MSGGCAANAFPPLPSEFSPRCCVVQALTLAALPELSRVMDKALLHSVHDPVISCSCSCGKSCLNAPFQQPHVCLVASKPTLIQALQHINFSLPDAGPVCLLVPQRITSNSSAQKALQACQLLHKYPSDHPLAVAASGMSASRKPSCLLVYKITPPSGSIATSRALSSGLPVPLDMVFQCQIQGHSFRCLFDSGSTHTFVSRTLTHTLGLSPAPSRIKSVATAGGDSARVWGHVASLRCSWGRPGLLTILPDAHVLESLVQGVDLILGQDFLRPNHVIMDYGIGQCTLGIFKRARLAVATPAPQPPSTSVPCVDPDEDDPELPIPSCSALEAQCAVRQGCPVYLCMVKSSAPLHPAAPAAPPDLVQRLPSMDHLTPALRATLIDLLTRFPDVFPKDIPPGLPSNHIPFEAVPLLPNSKPPYRKQFRLSPLERAEIDKQVQRLLRLGHIQPSHSPFGAPVLVVPKPRSPGEWRLVYDYRELNKLTLRNNWPIPRIDDLLDSFRGASYFTSLDLLQGYNQLALQPSDIPKTAFTCHLGSFEWRVLSMGLTNSPSIFQRTMSHILAPYIGKFCLVYLDDICILSRTAAEAVEHLRIILDCLRKHKLYARLDKCSFLTSELTYLGHIMDTHGIRADPKKLQALQDWQFPTSGHGMLSFLGLANYFRKFVPNFSRVAAPLYHLTKPKVQFSDAQLYRTHFTLLKEALLTPPTLAYPDPEQPFELISDASITGCGAVLVQHGRPVAYFSSKFCSAERNYSTGEQELLGVIKALKEWRCYLEGCVKMTIVTDHHPLTHLPRQHLLSRRQARWSEFLSRFTFDWKHRPGATNPADGLSRVHCNVLICNSITTALELHHALVSRIPNQYCYDQQYESPQFIDSHGLSWGQGFWTDAQQRIAVPITMVHDIIAAHHDALQAGHFGVDRTVELVARNFWWPRMHADVASYVKHCPECQRSKALHQRPYGLLQPLPIPDERWHTVSLDWITGFSTTARGHNSILVFVDKLTKMVHLAPTSKRCTVDETARLFFQHVESKHGTPRQLITDRDSRLTSDFWAQLSKRLGITMLMSTAFHPETDGQTERTNKVVEEVLRNFLGTSRSWDDLLPFVEFAINNAKSASTGYSPFYLNYGAHPRTRITNQIPGTPDVSLPVLQQLFDNRDHALLRVRQLLQAAQDRQKHYADQHRRPHTFLAGQQVLLSSKHLRFTGTGKRKLFPKFMGPFTIRDMVGHNAARLDLPSTWRIHNVFHVSLLRPYHARNTSRPVPLPSVVDGLPSYEVESIISHRDLKVGSHTVRQYLVKWQGFLDEHNSWETVDDLPEAAISSYLARR